MQYVASLEKDKQYVTRPNSWMLTDRIHYFCVQWQNLAILPLQTTYLLDKSVLSMEKVRKPRRKAKFSQEVVQWYPGGSPALERLALLFGCHICSKFKLFKRFIWGHTTGNLQFYEYCKLKVESLAFKFQEFFIAELNTSMSAVQSEMISLCWKFIWVRHSVTFMVWWQYQRNNHFVFEISSTSGIPYLIQYGAANYRLVVWAWFRIFLDARVIKYQVPLILSLETTRKDRKCFVRHMYSIFYGSFLPYFALQQMGGICSTLAIPTVLKACKRVHCIYYGHDDVC